MIESTPFVSILVPIRNEASFIERGLRAIAEQDYPIDRMEVLIADGRSTDDTRLIALQFAKSHPGLIIRVLDNPAKVVPNGINISLRQARGEFILRVDGHTAIAPDYVRHCVETLGRTRADNVGGRMTGIGLNSFGKAVALATSTPFGVGGGRFHYSDKEEWVDTVYMGAWPKRVFEKIGLFDEELVRDQDDEFNYRLRGAGGRILLNPKIKSEYTVRSSASALWKQYFQYGFWKVRVLQKHPRQMSLRQFVPPAFVLAMLGSMALALFPASRLLSPVVPALYVVSNLLASIYTAARRGWTYLPSLPVVFFILHGSYGLGFLAGLIKFWNRWGDKTGRTPAISGELLG